MTAVCAPGTVHHRIDRMTGDEARTAALALVDALRAAESLAAHMAAAGVGGCRTCRTAMDVGELDLHACVTAGWWQQVINDTYRGLM